MERHEIEERSKEILEDNGIGTDFLDEVVESVMNDEPDEFDLDELIWDAIHDWDLV